MAIRDVLRRASDPFVRPDETIQAVFPGESGSLIARTVLVQFGAIGGVIAIFTRKLRIFTVTDQRILVLDAGRWSFRKARGVVTELPRGAELGPAGKGIWHTVTAGDEKIRVHRRFFKDLNAADAAIAPMIG